MTNQTLARKYIGVEQMLVKFNGISRSTLTRLCNTGYLPKPVKMGQLLYWDEAAVDAKMDANAAAQDAA